MTVNTLTLRVSESTGTIDSGNGDISKSTFKRGPILCIPAEEKLHCFGVDAQQDLSLHPQLLLEATVDFVANQFLLLAPVY